MLASYYASIRNLLKNDSTMQTLLGGEYVYVAHVAQTNQIPCVTLLQNSETTKKRVGYQSSKERENSPVVQLDVWSNKSFLETINVANQIDVLLNDTGIDSEWALVKVGDSDQFEPDTRLYHKTLRYGFVYKVDDS